MQERYRPRVSFGGLSLMIRHALLIPVRVGHVTHADQLARAVRGRGTTSVPPRYIKLASASKEQRDPDLKQASAARILIVLDRSMLHL